MRYGKFPWCLHNREEVTVEYEGPELDYIDIWVTTQDGNTHELDELDPVDVEEIYDEVERNFYDVEIEVEDADWLLEEAAKHEDDDNA